MGTVTLHVGPLVRSISITEVVIWAEFSHPCLVTLTAQEEGASAQESVTTTAHTVTIGSHLYTALHLRGLRPATWYRYQLETPEQDVQFTAQNTHTPIVQCFRTLEDSETAQETPLRLRYGSCRKLNMPQHDTLNAFGKWLSETIEQREQLWPHVLLLTGDQIYADRPPSTLKKQHPHLHQGIVTFDDFALLYRHAWTDNTSIRQVLAALPTYMIFDDHEVVDDWNTWATWRAEALHDGQEQVLVDGLVAYWVYQGWGNLLPHEHIQHPLLQIMQAGEKSGEDVLETLRTCLRQTMYGKTEIPWHYTIHTTPPIFVANTRADRSTVFDNDKTQIYGPTRIMGKQQVADLQSWLSMHDAGTALLVSAVPVLLPPMIGFAEYVMGSRLWERSIAPLRWVGQGLARLQLRVGIKANFDQWPFYTTTWHELKELIGKHRGDIIILSGDVHFSYVAEGRLTDPTAKEARIYQLVASPIQNELEPENRSKVAAQSFVSRISYGGVQTRILPLEKTRHTVEMQRNILFKNTLAAVTLQPDKGKHYRIQQEYHSIVDERLEVVGHITLPDA